MPLIIFCTSICICTYSPDLISLRGWERAVSYTHLDVYKRQVQSHGQIVVFGQQLMKQLRVHELLYRCLLYTSRCV
ncbi:hypothetical protein [Erwinia amylovora]